MVHLGNYIYGYGDMVTRLSIAARTTLIYLAIGIAWILFSDSFVNLLLGPDKGALFQLLKGLFYVCATALAGYIMLRQAIRRVERSEARYRSIFESSADALLLLAEDGRILDANDVACAWYGYTREQLLEMNFQRIADCENCPQADNCGVASALLGKQMEAVHCRANGTPFPVEVLATPIDDDGAKKRILVNVRDISVRVRAEQDLKQSEARYRTYVDNAPLGIVIADRSGKCLDANQAACDMFGYTASELHGKSFISFYTEPQVISPDAINAFFNAGTLRVERKLERKDKSQFDALINAVTLDDQTGIAFINDVTEQRQLQQEVQRAAHMESVGRLAGGVAHDLNNLLQVIGGHAELLRERTRNTLDLAPDLGNIIDATNRAGALVRQLLAFSRKQVISPTHLDLNHVVEEMLKLINRTIGEHIQVEFQPGQDVGTTFADLSQLEQVIMNLCVNARDAMPDGGTLHISTSRVKLDEGEAQIHPDARPQTYVRLRVQDSGVGMDEETSSHIFEPFYTTKGFGAGMGLGLATVYGIVAQHGGFISVYSAPGQGASFDVHLPASEVAVNIIATPAQAPPSSGHETVLLAEDDPGVRMLTNRILSGAGYCVIEACDGREAMRLAEENLAAIDLALLDVVMPHLGGKAVHDLLKKLRPELPVLFMSGYTSGAVDTNSVLQPGMELVAKPFDQATLLHRVRAVLDAARK